LRLCTRSVRCIPSPSTPGHMAPHHTTIREQREIDADARLVISAELGHSREAITAAYLGR